MKKIGLFFLIFIWTESFVYSQGRNNAISKLQSNFTEYIRYPEDLERKAIPSFFVIKVQYDSRKKLYDLDFSDSADPLIVKEILRIKDKLNFSSVYEDLNVSNQDIPILIPIIIQMANVSASFSDPKSTVVPNLYNFKRKPAFGVFYFYPPLSLFITNN